MPFLSLILDLMVIYEPPNKEVQQQQLFLGVNENYKRKNSWVLDRLQHFD